jgi:hypothetical protein
MTQGWNRSGHIGSSPENGSEFESHSAPERGSGASIWAGHFAAVTARQIRRKTGAAAHGDVDPAAFPARLEPNLLVKIQGFETVFASASEAIPATRNDRIASSLARLAMTAATLAPDNPDQDQTRNRGSQADRTQHVVRRRQRALHGPAHPGRARREQQAFEHKQNTQTDEEVGERYGPHRTETSRLVLFFASGIRTEARFRFGLSLF